MRKLLSAGYARLWKDKVFWSCIAVMLVYAVLYMRSGCRQAAALPEYSYTLDQYYFHFAIFIGFICALFCSLFLGTEYSDGVVRNKIIAGHTRSSIYLSNLLLTFSAACFFLLTWLVMGAVAAVPSLGFLEMEPAQWLLYLLTALLFLAAFCALFTLTGMLCSNKAAGAVIAILLFLGLLLCSSIVYDGLTQPKMIEQIEMTVNGLSTGTPEPNPAYITGMQRRVYEFLLDFLPTGQGLKMWMREISDPSRMLISSAVITGAATACGLVLFQRKNLK